MNRETLYPAGMGIDKHAVLYKSKNKMVRAINQKYKGFYLDLLNDKVIKELILKDILIQTEKSNFNIEGHDLVLEHPILPFVSYPFEWTPSMFKEASKTILKLNIVLMKHGLCTQDAHPWNILFDGTKPKFIDFTSIVRLPSSGKWIALEEFNNYCLNSLILMSKGYQTTARSLLREIFCYPDSFLVNRLSENKIKCFPAASKTIAIKMLSRMPPSTAKVLRDAFVIFYENRVACSKKVTGVLDLELLLNKIDSIDVKPKQ